MIIEWDTKFELHIPVIDAQHKQIISCLNELERSMKRGVKVGDIADILTRTQHYAVRHFGIEEKYMREANYPGIDKQLLAHKYFAERFTAIYEDFTSKGLTPEVVSSLKQELSGWIKDHVTGLDLAFGAYYKKYLAEIAKTE
ncbi:MAG: bacteriohemerythrin [Desulforhopalus sp.]|nr:bacteriohemerythrin [Desulforhopalus sp.]